MGGLWFETARLPGGWAARVRIEVAEGLIAAVTEGVDPSPGDARHAIALPGLCNVHTHGFQRGMAGLTEHRGASPAGDARDDFWSWRALMYRFLDRLTPDDVRAFTAQAYVEMLESGFTRVGEFHYLHHDPAGEPYAAAGEMAAQIVAAAADTGVGLTLLPVYYRQSNFGGAPAVHGQRRFLNDPDRFARVVEASREAVAALPDANLGVAPHSLRAVTPQDLSAILGLAADGPIHIHAAEQTKEVDDCLAWCGRRPVDWLLDEAGVDARWCLIHATHLSETETARLAASGAVAGLCPITEANLGDGVFPAHAYLAAGGAFGVGSDSNVLIDPAQELRALEYGQRLTRRARNVLGGESGASTGAELFDRALAGGAQALGRAKAGLAVGASADIASLKASDLSLAARSGDRLLDGWIFTAGARAVDCVWRRGELVVEDGRHVRGAAIAAAFRAALERLLAT